MHARRDVLRRLLAEMSDQPSLAPLAVEPMRAAIADAARYLGALPRAPGGDDRWERAGRLVRSVYALALAGAAPRGAVGYEAVEEALRVAA